MVRSRSMVVDARVVVRVNNWLAEVRENNLGFQAAVLTLCCLPHHMWRNQRDEGEGKSKFGGVEVGESRYLNARDRRIGN